MECLKNFENAYLVFSNTKVIMSEKPTVSSLSVTSQIRPSFTGQAGVPESAGTQKLIDGLRLEPHPEGGYFVETDRDVRRVPNPYGSGPGAKLISSDPDNHPENDPTRSASTTIFYLLTPTGPKGIFHRNKARCIHTLHKGRGRYVVIHPESDPDNGKVRTPARIETFVVGQDVANGERLQWIVEGGLWKSSFLLPDEEDGSTSEEGLLISEVSQPLPPFRPYEL